MSKRGNRSREIRALWATLAVIALLGAGAAFGATRYAQIDAERDATRDAHRLAVDVLQPLLIPADTQSPVRGVRYDQLLASVRERVLAGPINGVRLWRGDGTVLFSDEPALVGTHETEMREDVHEAIAGTSLGDVSGDRFRTLTSLRIGEPPAVVAVELDESHAALGRDRGRPLGPVDEPGAHGRGRLRSPVGYHRARGRRPEGRAAQDLSYRSPRHDGHPSRHCDPARPGGLASPEDRARARQRPPRVHRSGLPGAGRRRRRAEEELELAIQERVRPA